MGLVRKQYWYCLPPLGSCAVLQDRGVVKSGSLGQEVMEGTLCAGQRPWVLNRKIDHTVGPEAFEK